MKKIVGWASAALFTLLAGPSPAALIPVDFYSSPLDDGDKPAQDPPMLGEGIHVLNLWADPSAAEGGGTYGIQDVLLRASGAFSIVSFVCDAGCLAGIPVDPSLEAFFTAGDDVNGDFAPFAIGTLTLNVAPGAGALTLISGTALDATFVGDDLVPGDIIATTIPEPGSSFLVGIGMIGIALRRRLRRRLRDRGAT